MEEVVLWTNIVPLKRSARKMAFWSRRMRPSARRLCKWRAPKCRDFVAPAAECTWPHSRPWSACTKILCFLKSRGYELSQGLVTSSKIVLICPQNSPQLGIMRWFRSACDMSCTDGWIHLKHALAERRRLWWRKRRKNDGANEFSAVNLLKQECIRESNHELHHYEKQ